VKVLELTSKTTYEPYPSVEFQSTIVTCLSLRIDSKDRLWLLDYAHHGLTKRPPKLIAFQLEGSGESVQSADRRPIIEYAFPKEVAGMGSMLNDFVIDPSGKYVYIIDTSIVGLTPAIVVYSVGWNESVRMLNAHPSMYGQSIFLNVLGNLIKFGPFGLKINADSLALDRTGNHLYYGALTGSSMYRISTSHLLAYIRLCHDRGLKSLPINEGKTPNVCFRVALIKICMFIIV
jgi:hypothetical protein